MDNYDTYMAKKSLTVYYDEDIERADETEIEREIDEFVQDYFNSVQVAEINVQGMSRPYEVLVTVLYTESDVRDVDIEYGLSTADFAHNARLN